MAENETATREAWKATAKFRSREPVVVDAAQFLIGDLLPAGVFHFNKNLDLHGYRVNTPTGMVKIVLGDWVVTDGKGGRHVVEQRFFDTLWEPCSDRRCAVTVL